MSLGDTPDHSQEPLCLSCKYAVVQRGYAESQIEIRCQQMNERVIPFPIYECSYYLHKMERELHELERIAYILERKGSVIGFHPPRRRGED